MVVNLPLTHISYLISYF